MAEPRSVTILAYRPECRQGVHDLILGIQRDEFGMQVTLADQPDLLDIPGFYQKEAGGFWVAMAGHGVIGTLGLLDIGSGDGALRKMFVAKAWRGRTHAIADRLLARLIAHACGRGIDQIYLGTTDRFHAAHRYYERNGFSRLHPGGLPAAFPVMTVDSIFYHRATRSRPITRECHIADESDPDGGA